MLLAFVLFGVLFIAVALIISRKSKVDDVDDFLLAGRRLPFGVVAASVMVSWLWTTSLLGAAEAGYLFGIGGGFAFAIGSAVPFFVFIPLALRLRRIMPSGTTYLEFVQQRYGNVVHKLLLGLTVLLSLYICVEQVIGIAYAISLPYDASYTAVAIGATAIVVGYIAIAGLRGAVINDVIQFVVISAVALVLIPLVLHRFGMHELYTGLKAVADGHSQVDRPDALNFFAPAAVRYLAVALVVSMGFVLLNQGYYSKAHSAASNKSLLWAYVIGTVLAWAPIPIIFGLVLGGIGLSGQLDVGDELRVTTDVAGYVLSDNFGGVGSLLFALVIFMAGLTTAGNSLAGFQAIVAVDLGRGQAADERARKRTVRWYTLGFGAFVAIGAVALEGVSLLQIDVVSGILFATPIGALVGGMWSGRPTGRVAVASIVVGLAAGIGTYLVIDDPEVDYFYGNVVSLLVPVVVMVAGSAWSRRRFDFAEFDTGTPAAVTNERTT